MIYVIASVLLNAFAQVFMKIASERAISLKSLLLNEKLYVASFLYLLSILLWLKGLSTMPLSKAYPFQSLGYLIVFLLSFLLLNERFTVSQLVGVAIILLGISVLGLTN